MDELNRALSEYSAYFGIIAAFLAFASWLATNYFGDRAKSADDALRNAETEFREFQRFQQIFTLMSEEAQSWDHVYTTVRKLADEKMTSEEQHINDRASTLLRAQYARHGDRFLLCELERAGQLVDIVKVLRLPSRELDKKATAVRDDIIKLFNQRQSAKNKIADVMSAGSVDTIPESEWKCVEAAIAEYCQLVGKDLAQEENRVSIAVAELEVNVLDSQRAEQLRRKRVSTVVKKLAIIPYVASAVLALYGKWLEAQYPKPKQGGGGASTAHSNAACIGHVASPSRWQGAAMAEETSGHYFCTCKSSTTTAPLSASIAAGSSAS